MCCLILLILPAFTSSCTSCNALPKLFIENRDSPWCWKSSLQNEPRSAISQPSRIWKTGCSAPKLSKILDSLGAEQPVFQIRLGCEIADRGSFWSDDFQHQGESRFSMNNFGSALQEVQDEVKAGSINKMRQHIVARHPEVQQRDPVLC